MRKENKRLNDVIVGIAMILILAIGAIGAYFTSTDTATNVFTVGSVKIDLTEPNWDDSAENITPNQQILKDPMLTNESTGNDAFVFVKVTVPKKTIATAATETGVKADAASTQLFQLNSTDNTGKGTGLSWNGTDTYNTSDWYLVKSDTTGTDNNVYVFAYGSKDACKALAASKTTKPVFDSVTFCNAVENDDIENASYSVLVEGYGIQTNDLTSSDKTAPADVWAILTGQLAA